CTDTATTDIYTLSLHDALPIFRTSQEHLLALVNDLLNVSRLESGQLKYDLAPVPVQRLLLDLEAMILPQAQGKGVAFEREDCSRSEEHTSELQSRENLVCRLLL